MSGDHTDYRGFVRRALTAYGRRVAVSDPEDLAELVSLRVDLDAAIDTAVIGLRRRGVSWSQIASALGITKQSAHERWGVRAALTVPVEMEIG